MSDGCRRGDPGMVSDKRVFPTKDKNWVTLARRPMVADDRELEKIFRARPGVCLLNLPPPDKKHGAGARGKAGDNRGTYLPRVSPPGFNP